MNIFCFVFLLCQEHEDESSSMFDEYFQGHQNEWRIFQSNYTWNTFNWTKTFFFSKDAILESYLFNEKGNTWLFISSMPKSSCNYSEMAGVSSGIF